MTIGSLFSGIGGLELGLERAGLGPTLWQAECDEFCLDVLAKHWPRALRYNDVRRVSEATPWVDLICGGFPCQPHSVAGKRRGTADSRWLWPAFRDVVGGLRPSWVVIENVPALRTSGLRDVLCDLANLGFDAEWTCVGASDVGAPHRRQRLFIAASHPDRTVVRQQPGWLSRACREGALEFVRAGAERLVADTDGEGEPQQGGTESAQWEWTRDGSWRSPVSPVRRVDDGIPARFHGRRLKALGNAVVPQVAEVIGRAIVEAQRG